MDYLQRKRNYVRAYSFLELLTLWKQQKFTVEEVIDPTMEALKAFKVRALRLDYKLLPLTDVDELDYLDEYMDMETLQLIENLPRNMKTAYKAVDHLLEQFAIMELRLIQMEQDYDEIAYELDFTASYLN